MPKIDYSRIPYKEKRSTGEKIVRNAFYMADEDLSLDLYQNFFSYDFSDLKVNDAIFSIRRPKSDQES